MVLVITEAITELVLVKVSPKLLVVTKRYLNPLIAAGLDDKVKVGVVNVEYVTEYAAASKFPVIFVHELPPSALLCQ